MNFLSNDSGASLVEYGLLVGLIAVVSIAAITALGEQIESLFNTVEGELNGVENDVTGTGS